jgi:hypothetical protein
MSLITDGRKLLCSASCDLVACTTVGMGRSNLPDSQVKTEVVCGVPYYIWTAADRLQVMRTDMRYFVKYSHVTAGDPTTKPTGKTPNQTEAEEPALLGSIFEKNITNDVDLLRCRTAVARTAARKPATAPEGKDVLSLERAPNIQLVPNTASYRSYLDYSVLRCKLPRLFGKSTADVYLGAYGGSVLTDSS